VSRPGIAVDAAVLATAIGIDAGFKSDIRTVVGGDERTRGVLRERRRRCGPIVVADIVCPLFIVEGLEAISRIAKSAPAMDGQMGGHLPPLNISLLSITLIDLMLEVKIQPS